MKRSTKQLKRVSRQQRIRARVKGDSLKPRLSVFRSIRFIYAQIIDDMKGVTLVAADTRKVSSGTGTVRKIAEAHALGKQVAELARAKGIVKVVFDHGGNRYHGRVKAVAEGAREGGLQF